MVLFDTSFGMSRLEILHPDRANKIKQMKSLGLVSEPRDYENQHKVIHVFLMLKL